MEKNNAKKKLQLGEDPGTASHKLKKRIMFHYVKLAGDNICHQCGKEIIIIDEFSIEHKIPWLDSESPKEFFNSLENIVFSHLKCNITASRKVLCPHGSARKYNQGCRCKICTNANTNKVFQFRQRKKTKLQNAIVVQLAETR